MDWLWCGVYCGLLTLAGWPWVPVLCGRRPTPVGWASLAYLSGAALVTLGLLLAALAHIPITRLTVIGAMVAAGALGLGAWRPRRMACIRQPPLPGSLRAAAPALAVAGAGIAYLTAKAILSGHVDGTDFVAFWGKKGLVVFFEHSLDFGHGLHANYPLELGNLYGGLYLFLGHVNDQVIRIPLLLYGAALAGAAWWLCRLVMPPIWAAVAIALPTTTPQLDVSVMNGSADAAVAAYLTVCVLACNLWVREDDPRWAGLAGLAAGGAAWCKLEGGLTGLVLLATVVLLRRRVRDLGLLVAGAWLALFTLPWILFQHLHHLPSDHRQFSHTDFNVPWIVAHVWDKLLLQPSVWGGFWIVCLAVILLAAPFWWHSPWRSLAALTLPNLVLTMGAYMDTYQVSDQAVAVTASRLYLHLAPSVAVMAAAAAAVAWAAARPAPAAPR